MDHSACILHGKKKNYNCWPAALKNVTAVSSDFAAELMSSNGMGKDDMLLTFYKASTDTFPLCSLLLSPRSALVAFSVAVLPNSI